jgi:hypothetical protein
LREAAVHAAVLHWFAATSAATAVDAMLAKHAIATLIGSVPTRESADAPRRRVANTRANRSTSYGDFVSRAWSPPYAISTPASKKGLKTPSRSRRSRLDRHPYFNRTRDNPDSAVLAVVAKLRVGQEQHLRAVWPHDFGIAAGNPSSQRLTHEDRMTAVTDPWAGFLNAAN